MKTCKLEIQKKTVSELNNFSSDMITVITCNRAITVITCDKAITVITCI